MKSPLIVDADFPGGNVFIRGIEGDTLKVRQDPRDTARFWFYWCFRVCGAAGRTLKFSFPTHNLFTSRGPAISTDQGGSWRWMGIDIDESATFHYTFTDNAEVRFSMAMPYLQANWERFVASLPKSEHVSQGLLTTSNGGREVELLRVGNLSEQERAPHHILIAARHHCCEMMANYVIEGIVQAALAEDEPGRRLRERVAFTLVPFADKDGVEQGDQGKGRHPHDHGRDYIDESIYAETKAIKKLITEQRPDVSMVFDLHCPWIRGYPNNERIYCVESNDPQGVKTERGRRFSRVLESVIRGPLPYAATNDLPFGSDWNVPANYGNFMGLKRWAMDQPNIHAAVTIEIPYATADGVAVDADSARAFGRDLAAAIDQHCNL